MADWYMCVPRKNWLKRSSSSIKLEPICCDCPILQITRTDCDILILFRSMGFDHLFQCIEEKRIINEKEVKTQVTETRQNLSKKFPENSFFCYWCWPHSLKGCDKNWVIREKCLLQTKIDQNVCLPCAAFFARSVRLPDFGDPSLSVWEPKWPLKYHSSSPWP